MVRRILAAAAAVVLLTACRVDVTTTVAAQADGSGRLTVEAVADAEVVDSAPGLADDLRFDDLVASGWTVEGPTPTADGGLRVVLRHDFAGPAEATELMGQINGDDGPYRDLALTRTVDDETATMLLDGALGVTGGVEAFADEALLTLVGEAPYASDLADRDVDVHDVFGARLVVALPDADGHSVAVDDTTTGTDEDSEGDAAPVVFDMPADGSVAPVSVRTVIDLTPDARSPLVAAVAGTALLIWLVVSVAFAAFVLRSRRVPTGPTSRRPPSRPKGGPPRTTRR